MESKKESVKQLLVDLEKRNADSKGAGVGSDMSVGLSVRPSDVANTIHDMVTKSRPRGVVERPTPAATVSTIAEAFVAPPAPSREEEEEKQRQEEEERRREQEEQRRDEQHRREENERQRNAEIAQATAAEKERQEQQRRRQEEVAVAPAAVPAAPPAPPVPSDTERRAEGSGHEVMLQVCTDTASASRCPLQAASVPHCFTPMLPPSHASALPPPPPAAADRGRCFTSLSI